MSDEQGLVDDEVVVITESDDLGAVTDVVDDLNVVTDSYRREPLPSTDVFGDFVVGPGRFDVQLAPGETRVMELTVANRLGVGRFFSVTAEDMVSAGRGDGAVTLLGDEIGPYTLRDFVSVPYDRFFVEHGQRVRIPVTVSLPPDAEPGGRYGSLLIQTATDPADPGQGAGARSGSTVISRIGTLFFVTTPGDIDRDTALIDFRTRNTQRFFATGPITFDIVTENFGTVHTTPYGRVVITNILGEEVGSVNLDPWFVMPQSIRSRDLTWNRELLIGRYTATAQINRGYDDIIDEMSFTFYVIPWTLVGGIFFGLFTFFLLLRFFFSRFEFKRKE